MFHAITYLPTEYNTFALHNIRFGGYKKEESAIRAAKKYALKYRCTCVVQVGQTIRSIH